MTDLQQIAGFYRAAFEAFDKRRQAPPVMVEFYAYVGLRHTIRIRAGEVLVRLSDLTKDAPAHVQRALAEILVAKLLRRRVSQRASEVYNEFARQSHIATQATERRRERGRKITTAPGGAVYDLVEIFQAINRGFFQNQLAQPILSWSTQKTCRIFGHHDALHETVVISRTLDDSLVPRFVVEFVMYHELLHIKHPTRVINSRRQIHSRAFRLDERKFPDFEAAEKWLEKLARRGR